MLRSTLIALTVVGTAAPAFAGSYAPAPVDPVIAAPAPAPMMSPDWTGAYGGLSLGYGELGKDDTDDAMIYGVQAGYNYDMGKYIVGGELEYAARDMWDHNAADSTRLKGRIGYDLGSTMVYGVVGATMIDQQGGYAVGLGAEHMVTDKIGLGAEYLYENIGDFDSGSKDLIGNSIALRANYHF